MSNTQKKSIIIRFPTTHQTITKAYIQITYRLRKVYDGVSLEKKINERAFLKSVGVQICLIYHINLDENFV